MIQYTQDRSRRDESPRGSETRADFWVGLYWVDYISDNGSVKIMLPDAKTISVNRRFLKAVIYKEKDTQDK
jgi:hypothetical protein